MKRLLAILVVVSTSFVPLSGQVASPRCIECEARLDENLSNPVVVRKALNSIHSLTLKIQAETVSVEDVDSTVTASKTLFAHLEEQGVYTALDSTLLDQKQTALGAELMQKLEKLRIEVSEPPKVLPLAKPSHCRNYSIAAAAYGVCCALGGIPCCILAAVAGLFAALCEAGYDV